jgi:ABC-type multidrug transport system fused ATPase/permease subunit
VEFIERLPEGYDTLIGDRGVRLSGGQCQRLALARAILRKPEILILDEATSSLDSASENLIKEAIDTVAKNTTIVCVAHRLSTIAHSDYVYVIDKGTVVEEGVHDDLLSREGIFAKMVHLQSGAGGRL